MQRPQRLRRSGKRYRLRRLSQTSESTGQTLLTALMLYLTELHEEYPENILVVAEE